MEAAVPMVMGANIGTTVTNTLVSLAHARRSEEFRLAFTAATMHDFFNVLAVAVILPLELMFGVLSKPAAAIANALAGEIGGGKFNSPIKGAVKWGAGHIESLLEKEIKSTDRGINTAQRDVRRELMIHASLQSRVDLQLVLSYMSTVKDAERIGDYSKNFYDLVKYGANFEDAQDRAELLSYRERVSNLLADAASTFDERDVDRARELIAKADGFLDDYDAQIKAAYRSTGTPADAVSRALYFRFLKRVTAHVMNFLTSLVLPVDRLDYYDEAKDDRG